jgi:hypothetical protein
MATMRILAGFLSVALLLAPKFAHADLAAVESLVAKKAAIVEMMHTKARKALVTAAQDDRYREYFAAGSADEQARLKAEIDRISLKVQAEFHVEEMCLIDPQGAEISRIVENSIAYDLASNETQNVFFTPGFALRPRTVYISPLYVSQDANRWVLGYVTPIVVDGVTKAILHYEHGLKIFQQALNKDQGGDVRYIVAVDGDGRVISDSRTPVATEKKGDSESSADYFASFGLGELDFPGLKARLGGGDKGSGTVATADGRYDVAYQTVGHWTLIAVDRL